MKTSSKSIRAWPSGRLHSGDLEGNYSFRWGLFELLKELWIQQKAWLRFSTTQHDSLSTAFSTLTDILVIQSHHERCIVHCPVRIAGIDGAAQHVYELQTECLAAVGQVSGITDAVEMWWQYMPEKPSYEFHAADSHGLCFPAIPVILVFKRHCAVIISSDAAVGYGSPVRIPGKIAYSIASAVEGLFYKWQPSFISWCILPHAVPHVIHMMCFQDTQDKTSGISSWSDICQMSS